MSKSIQLKNSNEEKMYPHPYYPIGSIYLSVVNTNPSKWFGGTWEQIAKGRTLVGVDTDDTDFDEVKKIGGEKAHQLTIDEMPKHNHNILKPRWGTSAGANAVYGSNSSGTGADYDYLGNQGADMPHNNLQPYFTCYIWCRTA